MTEQTSSLHARHTLGRKLPQLDHQHGFVILVLLVAPFWETLDSRPAAVDGSDVLAPGHSLGKVMAQGWQKER